MLGVKGDSLTAAGAHVHSLQLRVEISEQKYHQTSYEGFTSKIAEERYTVDVLFGHNAAKALKSLNYEVLNQFPCPWLDVPICMYYIFMRK